MGGCIGRGLLYVEEGGYSRKVMGGYTRRGLPYVEEGVTAGRGWVGVTVEMGMELQ